MELDDIIRENIRRAQELVSQINDEQTKHEFNERIAGITRMVTNKESTIQRLTEEVSKLQGELKSYTPSQTLTVPLSTYGDQKWHLITDPFAGTVLNNAWYHHTGPYEDQRRREEERRLEKKKSEIEERISHYEGRLEDIKDSLRKMQDDLESDLYNHEYHDCCNGSIRRFVKYIENSVANIEKKVDARLERLTDKLAGTDSLSAVSSMQSSLEDFRQDFNTLIGEYNRFIRNYNGEHYVPKGEWPGLLHGHSCPGG